jgi:hypothetical protein
MTHSNKFHLSERKLVKELYGMLYGAKSQNRYRLDGIPREEFLKTIKQPVLRRALASEIKDPNEVEDFKKIEFYLESCIEKGFIKQENDRLKLGAKGYRLISMGHYLDCIGSVMPIFIALLSLVATCFVAYYTGQQADVLRGQIQDSTNQASAQFVLSISDQLNSNKYAAILTAIESHPHTYSPLKTGFTDTQLEDYMGVFDTAGDLFRDKIITFQMAYDEFSYDTEKAYCNNDVQANIKRDRAGDTATGTNMFWSGFQNMATAFLKRDGYTCTSTILDNQ